MLNLVTVVPRDYAGAARYRVLADMLALDSAIKLFTLNTGAPPMELGQLHHAPPNSTTWRGPYLVECSPADPWGNEYVYILGPSSDWEIITYGADGSPGGVEDAADLSSRTLLPADD